MDRPLLVENVSLSSQSVTTHQSKETNCIFIRCLACFKDLVISDILEENLVFLQPVCADFFKNFVCTNLLPSEFSNNNEMIPSD